MSDEVTARELRTPVAMRSAVYQRNLRASILAMARQCTGDQSAHEKPQSRRRSGLILRSPRSCVILGLRDIPVAIGALAEKEVIQ
jgi:hypothetical protein